MMRHSSTHPAPVQPPLPKRSASTSGGFVASLAKSRETTLFVVLILLIAGTGLAKPQFLNLQNLRDVLLNVSIISLLTAGMTVVILMRHIDLSVGSTVGISAYAVGSLYVAFPHMPVLIALAAGLAIGLVAGGINALLVAVGRVPSLVATLSTLYIFRGADYAWVHGGQINATSLPDAYSRLATGTLLGIPTLALIAVVVLVGLAVYLKQFRGGRVHYAIGSNPARSPVSRALCGWPASAPSTRAPRRASSCRWSRRQWSAVSRSRGASARFWAPRSAHSCSG
jgi:rhamnose transport system permease protein